MADILRQAGDITTLAPTNLGTDIEWIEPETSDVLYVTNAGKGFYMLVNNLSGSNVPILTFDTPGTTTNIAVPIDDYVFTCTISDIKQIGPFVPIATFNTASDDIVQAASVTCTITGTVVSGELQIALIAVP